MNLNKTFYCMALGLGLLTTVACTSEASKTENSETEKIDSAATSLEQSNKELEEQTEKVEASLEKLDQDSAKTN